MTRFLTNYAYNVMVALSQLANTVFLAGDPDESISGRIGKSILAGGWASKVPWPKFLRDHWLYAVEADEGADSAAGRSQIG